GGEKNRSLGARFSALTARRVWIKTCPHIRDGITSWLTSEPTIGASDRPPGALSPGKGSGQDPGAASFTRTLKHMSGTHGRVGLTGRAWLGMALAACGLIAASGPNPAEACHITHHNTPAAEHVTPTPATPTPPASSPTDEFNKGLQT